ncbi:MAG: sodium:solute symporter [Eubacteriales bacterium]
MIYIICLVLYISLIIGISVFTRKKANNVDHFMLGGRAIPSWMSAFSYGTAYFSAVLFIGYAGKIGWNFGLGALWIVLGNTFVGSYLAWKVLASRTREMTHRLNASTMPEFLAVRYDSKIIKIIATMVIFIFLVPYAASVYKGLGYLFKIVFDIDVNIILFIMMALTAFYLFVGGFMAASIADFIQGIIMIAGVLLLIGYVVTHGNVEGFTTSVQNLNNIDPKLTQMIHKDTALGLFSLVILTSLGSWGLPQMVHKFYTIKNEKSIKTAKWVSTIFALIITFGAYYTGSLSRLVLNNNQPSSFDEVMPLVISEALPTFAAAIILVLVLSASMSTLASIVLAASSTVAVDLVKGVFNPDIEHKKMLWLLRILCVIFVIASYIMAIGNSPILNLASLSWGAVSGCLFAPYLLGLYWKKATKFGVYTSFTTALVILIYGVLKYDLSGSEIPTVGAFAIIIPVATMIISSLVSQSFSDEHIGHIYKQKTVGVEE